MASANFSAFDRTLRRMYWMDLIDRELDAQTVSRFRASLVVNARTGLPIERETTEQPDAK